MIISLKQKKRKLNWTTTYPLQIAWKIAYCVLILRRLQYFRCQQIQFQVANVLADMAEMKLKEQEQESPPLSRGLQLFMRAKAGLGKKTTPWKNYAYTHMTWDWVTVKSSEKHKHVIFLSGIFHEYCLVPLLVQARRPCWYEHF